MSSRYVRGSLAPRASASDSQWLEALSRFATAAGRPVLVPVDDASAIFVDDHYKSLAERFVIPKEPAGLHRLLASKRELAVLCRRLGVPAPVSHIPASEDEAVEIGNALGFPVVLKQVEPWLRARLDARSVFVARTGAELITAYRSLESPVYAEAMMQEYIPGGPETVWMFNGYFSAGSECLVGFTGRKLRQSGQHTGPATLGICVWNEAVAKAATRIMRELGYAGIVDMDFRYDERDGQYKLLDINPRLGGSFRLFVGENDLDVVRAAYLDLTGQPVPPGRARDGRKWMLEPYDLLVSAQMAVDRALTLPAWARSLRNVDEAAWWALDDPLPFLSMCASLVPVALRQPQIRDASSSGNNRATLVDQAAVRATGRVPGIQLTTKPAIVDSSFRGGRNDHQPQAQARSDCSRRPRGAVA